MKLSAAIGVVVFTACASARQQLPLLSVRDVVTNSHQFDGKVIRVEGIVHRCQQLGCDLLDTKQPTEFGFGLGTNPTFDEKIRRNLGKRIIVEGQVDATCLHQGESSLPDGQTETIICTDRASVLKNPKLVEVAR